MKRKPSAVILVAALALVMGMSPGRAGASSHSEAPGTTKDRLIDDTDLYAWVAGDAPSAVTVVGNWVPLIEPNSGPNFASFDDNASYYINVDNVGDSQKHLRFEFTFHTTRQNENTFLYNTGPVMSLTDPNLNVRQTWTLTRIDGGQETVLGSGQVAPYFVGPTSMPNYSALAQSAIQELAGGYKVFVGPRDDPFFVDLAAVFDLLSIRRPPGNMGKGVDGVGGYNVMSVVLQVPMDKLTKDGMSPDPSRSNNIIGIWDTAERAQTRVINGDGTIAFSGPETQVSRLGMPLVNEIVIPLGKKDLFNASEPSNDVANFGSFVVDPEPAKLLRAIFGINVPPAPRSDIVSVFATGVPGLNQPAGVSPGEMLRLNMSIAPAARPKRLGVLAGDIAGFPNGRRLADDVVDIELRVVAGVLVDGFNVAPNNQLGDGVDANDMPFLPYFPYVAPPHNPLNHEHHGRQTREGDVRESRERRAEAGWNGGRIEDALRVTTQSPGSRAVLQYTLQTPGRVSLRVFDVQGRSVRTLIDQDAAPGTFRAAWDGLTDRGSVAGRGVFFARLETDGRVLDTKKVVIQ
jgi:uncharacterized protein DUF4331